MEHLFLVLAKGASTGDDSALRRLRMLHQAIVDREEQGETLSRLLPGGLAEKLRKEGRKIGESEELEVTVLMSDIRSYSSIAERTSPTQLASQLNEHRAAMNRAILGVDGTVMQFVGDAVMAVFGAPFPQDDHADRAMEAAVAMHEVQRELNQAWQGSEREEFILGIGLSTGKAAAALLGSEERLEYTLVGDTVNLSQRLQDMARPGNATVLSDATYRALSSPPADAQPLGEVEIKGREATLAGVGPWRVRGDLEPASARRRLPHPHRAAPPRQEPRGARVPRGARGGHGGGLARRCPPLRHGVRPVPRGLPQSRCGSLRRRTRPRRPGHGRRACRWTSSTPSRTRWTSSSWPRSRAGSRRSSSRSSCPTTVSSRSSGCAPRWSMAGTRTARLRSRSR